jgi:hypothetical protein
MAWKQAKRPAAKVKAKPRRRRRGRRKGVMTAAWGAIAAIFTTAFLILQGTFTLISMILSVVVLALTALSEFIPQDSLGTDRQPRSAKPAQPRQMKGKRTAGPIIRCTATGKPVDTCQCAAKHVRTEDGARRYGGRIGAPIVTSNSRRAGQAKVANFSPQAARRPEPAKVRDLGRRTG